MIYDRYLYNWRIDNRTRLLDQLKWRLVQSQGAPRRPLYNVRSITWPSSMNKKQSQTIDTHRLQTSHNSYFPYKCISRAFSKHLCSRTTAKVRKFSQSQLANYRTFAVVREQKSLLNTLLCSIVVTWQLWSCGLVRGCGLKQHSVT